MKKKNNIINDKSNIDDSQTSELARSCVEELNDIGLSKDNDSF